MWKPSCAMRHQKTTKHTNSIHILARDATLNIKHFNQKNFIAVACKLFIYQILIKANKQNKSIDVCNIKVLFVKCPFSNLVCTTSNINRSVSAQWSSWYYKVQLSSHPQKQQFEYFLQQIDIKSIQFQHDRQFVDLQRK